MGKYPHMVIVGTGLAFGFMVGRLILAHMCDEPKSLKTEMCMSLLYLPFAFTNVLTAKLNDGVSLVDKSLVLFGFCLYTAYRHSTTGTHTHIWQPLHEYKYWESFRGIYSYNQSYRAFLHSYFLCNVSRRGLAFGVQWLQT